MSTPRRSWVASALVALVFLSACSTPVRINGAEVDSKVPFLPVLEQVWREKRADDKHARLATETGCWLLREPKTGNLQPRAFCGPIRHLKDLGKPGVFDELEFEARLIGDRNVTVDPDAVDAGDTGLEVPGGVELYRPDGKDPVPADQVPSPPIPKAEPGTIAESRSDRIDGELRPANGEIIAPGFTLTVSRVGAVATIPAEDAPVNEPADNEEFIAFTVTRQRDPDFKRGKASTSATYSLRYGDDLVDLKEQLGYGAGWTDQGDDEPVTLIASVPDGSEPELVVGVGGIDQTISLRTGERTSTTAAAYYRGETTFGVNRQYTPDPYAEGDYRLQHTVTFTEASVSPFDPDRGWAPPGRMWFYLDWDDRTSQGTGEQKNLYAAPDYNPGTSLRLTDSAGTELKIIEGNPVMKISYHDGGVVVAQLPDSARSIKVAYAPTGHFQVSSSYTDHDVAPKEGTFRFDALTFEIEL